MATLGLIDFKIGLHIKFIAKAGQNKFEVHIYQFAQNSHQLAQNRPDATSATWTLFGHNLVIFHPILTFFFSKCLFFKDKSFSSDFGFCPSFLLRGLTWAVLHEWTQNYPQNVGTCPGLPHQPLVRNTFFQSDRPDLNLDQ